jgi:hypothetical protein
VALLFDVIVPAGALAFFLGSLLSYLAKNSAIWELGKKLQIAFWRQYREFISTTCLPVQSTWEDVGKLGGGQNKDSNYFPGMLRNGGLALKTQGNMKGLVSRTNVILALFYTKTGYANANRTASKLCSSSSAKQ